MTKAADVDLLIVGQGLAGSAVAMGAVKRNYSILVLDEPSANCSSLVAAGLFNPITGRKMTKTWMADEVFPCLHHYYPDLEQLTGTRFFYSLPIYRPFLSIEEQNEWMGRSADESLRAFIADISATSRFGDQVNDPFGGLTLKQTGYLDTRAYLQAVRRYLEDRGAFEQCTFDAEKLAIHDAHVCYGQVRARRVVFCQGVFNKTNPWFRHLPVNSLKGEFITVQSAWKKDVILNRGVYMVPSGQSEWRVGATYNRSDQNPEITSLARKELTVKLEELVRLPFTIKSQQWGLRPTTPDRRPILGAHPDHRSLIIFNGLGTKGVSLAPYFSEVLFRWLENKGAIKKEADVTRFI